MVEKVFTLSTAHIPHSGEDFGSIRTEKHLYGYFLFLLSDYEDVAVPVWIEKIIKKALSKDCSYINFDCDGKIYSEFQEYEW